MYYIMVKEKGEKNFWREDGLNITEYSYKGARKEVERMLKLANGRCNNFEISIVRKEDGVIVETTKVYGGAQYGT